MFTAVSESSAESHLFKYAQVRNIFRNFFDVFRPVNSGIVEGVKIPILLVDRAGASSTGASVPGATSRPFLFIIMRSNLSSLHPCILPACSRNFRTFPLHPSLELFTRPERPVALPRVNPSSTRLMLTCYGLDRADDVSLE